MKEIIDSLTMFNFSKMEARTYVTLLQYPRLNGSQLAKILQVPRTTSYNALESLHTKGAIILIPGDVAVYKAETPTTLFARIEKEYTNHINTIRDELSKITINTKDEAFCNIKGYFNVIAKVKELLLGAKQEVCIHINIEISIFENELKTVLDRGVRVIVFSFNNINDTKLPIEFYFSERFGEFHAPYKKILMTIDNKRSIIARNPDGEDFVGVYSENPLLVDLVAQHFHHDIYQHKFEKREGIKNLVDDELLLGSLQEIAAKEFTQC